MMFTFHRLQIRKSLVLPFLCLLIALSGISLLPKNAHAEGAVTLESPLDGTVVPAGMLRISGSYSDAYGVKLYINGEKQVNAVMNDPDGDDSGIWYYDLDTAAYNGDVQLTAMATDNVTRYGVWSASIIVHVQNASAEHPLVTIVSPGDGTSVGGSVQVKLHAEAANPVNSLQVRINGGPWQNTAWNGIEYVYDWDTSGIGDKTSSIEAKAIDSKGNTGRSMTTYVKVGQGTHEPFVMNKQDRAMWIWESETYKLLLNPGSRNVLDAFAKDTATFGSDPVTTFYLAVGPFSGMNILEDDPGKLRDFIQWAHDRGYQIYACIAGGTTPPYLGAYSAYHDKAVREMESIINYNIAAGAGEKFDGINVDIEPYISPDFKNEFPSLQLQYLDGLSKMIQRRNTAGINLPFGPAIPKWFDSSPQAQSITWNGATKWLSEHVQDISDYISIMDYRDTADGSAGITAGGQGEIAYADSIGKPNSVVLGVETLDIANSGDPETITFREEGRAYMETELDKVYSAFSGNASFGGIAMHHYDSIRTLPSYWGPGGVVWSSPGDTEAPTAVSKNPAAKSASYQQIDLSFGMAFDNTEIDRYLIYRSTVSGFTPGPDNTVGEARSQAYSDIGLLPNTTYYYKVAARDMKGNIGPASAETRATTANTELKPIVLSDLQVTYTGTSAAASMRALDLATGQPVPGALIEGRFTFSGGKYTTGRSDASGRVTFTSEAIPSGRQIGFEPRRVTSAGYFWAQAYDVPHISALYPKAGLSGLTVSSGTVSPAFATETTRYTLTVPGTTSTIRVTPAVRVPGSTVTVNGQPIVSGQSSSPIPLQYGDNAVNILVTGPDGFKDAYSITVTRLIPVDNEFRAVEDTYVFENAPTANYGTSAGLDIVDISRTAGGGDRLSYMKFKFAGYAEPVQKALLNLYVPSAPQAPLVVYVDGYDGDGWSETGMNWNNRPGAGSLALGTISISKAGWYSLDVTGFIKSQMALDKTATFRLMDPNTRNILATVSSRENAGFAPFVTINPSSDASLQSLTLSQGEWTPAFSSDVFDYSIRLKQHQASVTVTPVTGESHATVSALGKTVISGQPSEPIPLAVGRNEIPIRVTAQSGSVQTYTLRFENPPQDIQPPVTSVAIDGAARNGWYVAAPVTVTLAAADEQSGIGLTEISLDSGANWLPYTAPIAITEDGVHHVSYRSVDGAGNAEAAQSVTVSLDTEEPVVTIAGAREYTIDEKVLITCTASDTVSGVTYNPCGLPLVDAPAYQLPIGTNTVAIAAEDAAGHIGSASSSYTVKATLPSLINLIRQWLSDSNEAGVVQSFVVKLQQGNWNAFQYEVEAQKGKKLTEDQADMLIRFVKALNGL